MTMDRRRFVTSMTVLGAGTLLLRPRLSLAGDGEALPFPELRAAGPAGDLGLAHGRAFADQIEHNLGFYLRWLSEAGRVKPARLLSRPRLVVAWFMPAPPLAGAPPGDQNPIREAVTVFTAPPAERPTEVTVNTPEPPSTIVTV